LVKLNVGLFFTYFSYLISTITYLYKTWLLSSRKLKVNEVIKIY